MPNPRRFGPTVTDLINESKKNPEVITIEATVITGFENAAMEECREKCNPLVVTRAQGRIFFNVDVQNFPKVLKLRSVDNLFLVNDALGTLDFSKDKEFDLELIKGLVQKVDWVTTLSVWAKLVNFKGVLFPPVPHSKVEDPAESEKLPLVETDRKKIDASIICDNEMENEKDHEDKNMEDNEVKNKKCIEIKDREDIIKENENVGEELVEAMSKILIECNSDINNELNESHFPKQKEKHTISESSEEVYFSAEEEMCCAKGDKKSAKKPEVDSNILKFRATCNRVGSHSFSSMEAAAHFGGALNDEFNWTVNLDNFDLNAILNINKEFCYVCSGITERSMHRRNITHFGYVTLRSTMCYNLVRLAEPVRGEIIVDPLCGGGSIPIEGTLGFPYTYHICGDNNEKAMNRTLANINHLKQSKDNLMLVDPVRWSVKKLPLRDSSVDVCVTDLPFGRRSGSKANNLPLYTDCLAEMARISRCATSRAVLLTHDKKSLTKALSGTNNLYWKQIRTVTVNQGGLFSTAFILIRTAKPFIII